MGIACFSRAAANAAPCLVMTIHEILYRDQAKKVEANLEACGGLSDSDHDRIGNPDWKFHCFLLGSTQATFKTLTTLKLSSIPTVIYTIYIYLYTAEKTGAEVLQKKRNSPSIDISLFYNGCL